MIYLFSKHCTLCCDIITEVVCEIVPLEKLDNNHNNEITSLEYQLCVDLISMTVCLLDSSFKFFARLSRALRTP